VSSPRSPLRASPAFAPALNPNALMETLIAGGVALLLFIYLFVAMIRPEKF
jgi:K+-transporting ATPase KdpF subunit